MAARSAWRRTPSGKIPFGKIPGKKSWATLLGKVVIWSSTTAPQTDENNDEYELDQEPGPDIKIYIPMYRAQEEHYFIFNLSELTSSELASFRKILSEALRQAAVITKLRDANAEELVSRGMLAPPRAYRSISKFFTTEG